MPITDAGELDLEAFERLLGERTRLLAVAHVSNALGTVNPVRELVAHGAHARRSRAGGRRPGGAAPAGGRAGAGLRLLRLLGPQGLRPTGIGVLYGRAALLERMPPWQGGGDMIATSPSSRPPTTPLPARFEAGTPTIAEVIGLGAALDYVDGVGLAPIGAWEDELLALRHRAGRASSTACG